MPVSETKNSLRSALENKSTEELEQLLSADFSEEEDAVPNVEYITTILEVIREREEEMSEQKAEVEAAWQEFRAFIREEEQTQKEQTETGKIESPSLDHLSNSKQGQAPQTKSHNKHHTRARVLRICAVVAALIVLFCGSAYAAGWNIFQALAQWTEETFGFLAGTEKNDEHGHGVYEYMRLEVAKRSDIPAVPNWAPEGTEQVGEIRIVEGSRKDNIVGVFAVGEQQFTVKFSVYSTMPETFATTYQKDGSVVQEYEVEGVVHYVMSNNEQRGASWINGNIEGTIQGALSVKELQRMIDSVYEG